MHYDTVVLAGFTRRSRFERWVIRDESECMSRRGFNKAVWAARRSRPHPNRRVRGANERIGVGFIGFGLIGKRHVSVNPLASGALTILSRNQNCYLFFVGDRRRDLPEYLRIRCEL